MKINRPLKDSILGQQQILPEILNQQYQYVLIQNAC